MKTVSLVALPTVLMLPSGRTYASLRTSWVIHEEIARLEQTRALLADSGTGLAHPGCPAGTSSGFGASSTTPGKRRTISAAGRARIAAAQKARWAKA